MSVASPANSQLISAIRAQSSSLNLLPLQRLDSGIQAVVLTAKHGVLYRLDQQQEVWEREEVEGPFFIVERSSPPFYQMIILNRRSIDNYLQPIQPDMTFEVQENYLFFQVHEEVVGIWCYEQQELQQAAAALNRIVSSIQDPNFKPQPPLPPPQPTTAKAAAAAASAPSKSSAPHRKPPPVIQTQPGKRLHARAPPPPSLQYGPALADGNERNLQARLSAFIRAFDEEDNAYAAAHEQAVQAQKAGKAAEAAQMLSVEEVERRLAKSRKAADNGRSGGGDGSLPPLLSQLFQQSQQQQSPAAANHSAQLQHSASDSQLHPLVSSLFQHSLASTTTPAAPAASYPPPSSSAAVAATAPAVSSSSIPTSSAPPRAVPAPVSGRGLSVQTEPEVPALLSPAAFLPTASAAPFSILLNGSASTSASASSTSSLPPLYLSLPPPPPHLSLADFRLHLQRLLSDDAQLRAWYEHYSAHSER